METRNARNGRWRLFPLDVIGKRRSDHTGSQAPQAIDPPRRLKTAAVSGRHQSLLFTTRQCADAVYAVDSCPSVAFVQCLEMTERTVKPVQQPRQWL